MKKKTKRKLPVLCILLCLLSCGCGKMNETERFSKEFGVDISQGNVVSDIDTHGGVFGEGVKLMAIDFTGVSINTKVKNNENWKELPLPEEINTIVYGVSDKETFSEPLIPYDEVGITIPKIERGYYYFKDRHSESTDPYNYKEILERASYNFTIAIYDADTDTLYICEMDT